MDERDPRPGRAEWPRRLRPGELIALDGLAAAGYALVFLLGPVTAASGTPVWVRWGVVATVAAPLAVRRRWPVAVCCLVLAASLPALWSGLVRDPLLAAGYALYPVALTAPRPPREPTTVIGVASAVLLAASVVVGPVPPAGTGAPVVPAVFGCALLGGVWTVGRAVRERRAYAAEAAARIARQAVTEERLRIARELHDVVSHTLSVIGVKAAIANHVADSRPGEARDALAVIERTSREALTEMRRMLGVLRSDDGHPTPGGVPGDPAPATAAELAPVPGLAGLDGLADRAAAAGVRVRLRVDGVARLSPGVELSVYRIVQEAVTNVVRHAAPATCQVTVVGDPAGVHVEVTDDGTGAGDLPVRPGHGLIGMRERVLLHGGEFAAGPSPAGGFRVAARLPLTPDDPAPHGAGG